MKTRYAATIATAVLFAAGCGYLPVQSDGGTGANADSSTDSLAATSAPVLNWTCQPYVDPSDGWNDADRITVTNPGDSPVMLSQWTVTYTNASGDVIGTDNGGAPGSDGSVDALLIQSGQIRDLTANTDVTNLSGDLTTYTDTYTDTPSGTDVTAHGTTDVSACQVTSWQGPNGYGG